jgi:hypothetical protein
VFRPVRVSRSTSVAESVSWRASSSFTVGQEAGVAVHLGPVEFEAEATVELGSERFGLAVTQQKLLS